MKVLVVDDYSTMRRIIRNLLTQIGYTDIDEASDGGDALQKLRQVHYGLVISDWNMEPMTGYDLLKQVRADEKLKTTPFIMVTAESKTDNVIAAYDFAVTALHWDPKNIILFGRSIGTGMAMSGPLSLYLCACTRVFVCIGGLFVVERSYIHKPHTH